MSSRVESESAFVLHKRPYRNTSLLVDFFTEKHGRITAVARSARGPRSRYKNIFRPFSLLWINWSGRMELRYLNQVEMQEVIIPPFTGKILYCGLYVNELLFKLLPREEAFPALFSSYLSLLKILPKTSTPNEIALRYFEKNLLKAIGYGLPLSKEANSKNNIHPDLFYNYIPKTGFVPTCKDVNKYIFSGKSLLAFYQETLKDPQLIKEIKRLTRIALQDALDYKKINARQFF